LGDYPQHFYNNNNSVCIAP